MARAAALAPWGSPGGEGRAERTGAASDATQPNPRCGAGWGIALRGDEVMGAVEAAEPAGVESRIRWLGRQLLSLVLKTPKTRVLLGKWRVMADFCPYRCGRRELSWEDYINKTF